LREAMADLVTDPLLLAAAAVLEAAAAMEEVLADLAFFLP
jgi:hypothetical protein